MGYWQHNTVSGSTQQTDFRTFTFGFDTPAATLPRTGSAHWLTDVLGLLTTPGKELRVVQGNADFDVDFAASAFRLQGYLNENQVVSTGGTSGALAIQSGGLLSAGTGFNGPLSYQSSNGILHGTLNGQFYGPSADEIGASFTAQDNGAAISGALTGQRSTRASTSDGIKNLTLTGPVTNELLRGPSAEMYATDDDALSGFQQIAATVSAVSVNLTANGVSSVGFNYQYNINPQDIVADGRTNFTTYKSTVAGSPVTVSLYKVGAANQELALTYTSFVSWIWPRGPGNSTLPGDTFDANFATYGIRTPRDLLTNRTGTATYDGVLYGRGASLAGTIYDLTGKSRFDVDFSAAQYTGSLDINGTTQSGNQTAIGHFTFGAAMGFGEMAEADIAGPSVNSARPHAIQPLFYGPSGQEIGAHFRFELNQTGTPESLALAGVAVAKAR